MKDYFMRQVEGFADMLSSVLFQRTSGKEELVFETRVSGEGHSLLIDLRLMLSLGLVNQAEDLLFDYASRPDAGDCRELAGQFYRWLSAWDDDDLAACCFSREEIALGIADMNRLTGSPQHFSNA